MPDRFDYDKPAVPMTIANGNRQKACFYILAFSSLKAIANVTINSYLHINSGASCSSAFIWASKQSQ
jgi:hypothetical protein